MAGKDERMTAGVQMLHNPRCSKSRQTLEILRDRGIEPEIIEYLKTPPDAARIDEILRLLDLAPRDLIRRQERVYTELGLDDPSLARQYLIQAMVDNPILIERPVVIAGAKAAIGRPPENILAVV